jgi:hypothetical protein
VSFIAHTPEVKYGVPVWVDKQRDESGSALPRAKGVKNELKSSRVRNSLGAILDVPCASWLIG